MNELSIQKLVFVGVNEFGIRENMCSKFALEVW